MVEEKLQMAQQQSLRTNDDSLNSTYHIHDCLSPRLLLCPIHGMNTPAKGTVSCKFKKVIQTHSH